MKSSPPFVSASLLFTPLSRNSYENILYSKISSMETPSSAKRLNNKIPISRKMEDSGNSGTKSSRKRDKNQQKALIDITNDSPIIGLANGSLLETPSSSIPSKQRSIVSTKAKKISGSETSTPGSGEALLRGQVKTLLQKVEEEAEFSKLNIPPFVRLQGFTSSSPMGILLAPTPVNTPQVSDLSGGDFSGLTSVTFSPVVDEQHLRISQGKVVSNTFDGKIMKQETLDDPIESEKSLNRALLFDFSDKSDSSNGDHHYKGEGKPTEISEDDTSSVWSVQVNLGQEEAEDEDVEEEEEYYCGYSNELDELCAGLENINVDDEDEDVNCINNKKFIGKHSRFVYDSDDEEIVKVVVEEEEEEEDVSSSSIGLHLKGLPTPKGKHLRFPEEEEEEEE